MGVHGAHGNKDNVGNRLKCDSFVSTGVASGPGSVMVTDPRLMPCDELS